MSDEVPDRLEISVGIFRAAAVGKLAVCGLLALGLTVLACKAFGVV